MAAGNINKFSLQTGERAHPIQAELLPLAGFILRVGYEWDANT